MPDYQNGKIYKLVSSNSNEIYIGSTTLLLSLRKAHHRRLYKSYKLNNIGRYCSSYKLFELGDVDIILIEEFKCDNKEQLHARERFYIEKNNCVNINIPGRNLTNKEYYENNKEKYLSKKRKYIKDHRTQINEKRRNEPIINCICGGFYKQHRKNRHLKTSKHMSYV